jgi:peptide chain release factor subunit 1
MASPVNGVVQAARRLVEHRSGHRVVSLYLDLDPERFATPPARASEIRSLIDEATRVVDGTEDLDHEERVALRSDVERIDAYLSSDEAPFQGSRALAVFSCSRDGLFEVVQLPRPVEARVMIESTPYIEPLVTATTQRRWGVLLISRRTARLLTGTATGLRERQRFDDFVHGQHQQGGYSQANYERSIEKDADDHLRHAADLVHRYWRNEKFDRLAVGGPPEIAARLESMLDKELRDRLVPGRLDADVAAATEDQVRAALSRLAGDDEKRSEREALDRLAAGIGAGGHATGGPSETVDALNERRVGTLLLGSSFDAHAARCPSCGLLILDGERRCVVDGTELEPIEHLREAAVEAAIAQDADVIVVSHYPDLGPFQGIGALLRF